MAKSKRKAAPPKQRKGKALQYNGANQRRHPAKRGMPFHPGDSLVSMTLR